MNYNDGKKVMIPIQVRNGKICYFYGEELPRIMDGAIGDLILDVAMVEDPEKVKVFQFEKEVTLFNKDTKLMFGISNKSIPKDRVGQATTLKKVIAPVYNHYVAVVLQEELKLKLKGTKKAALVKCKCNIPALEKDASSLNHAYTLLSREFEPDRISHGGNVFLNCYYYDEDNFWRNLDDKRETHMASFEYEHLIQGDFSAT